MDSSIATIAMSTPTIVLSYAAAFFFVVVAIAVVYALVKAGKVLDRVDTVLGDVDREAVPLMRKAGTSLDGVNANLGNVDQITKDVADITEKIDNMANAVEGAVSTPARKAASFSAGVQGAVSSFMRRDKSTPPAPAGSPRRRGRAAVGAHDAADPTPPPAAAAAAKARLRGRRNAADVAGAATEAVGHPASHRRRRRRRCRQRPRPRRPTRRSEHGPLDQTDRERRRRRRGSHLLHPRPA